MPMIFSNISRYSGPFNAFWYAREALQHTQRALSMWHYTRTGPYPPFEEDALPSYMLPRV